MSMNTPKFFFLILPWSETMKRPRGGVYGFPSHVPMSSDPRADSCIASTSFLSVLLRGGTVTGGKCSPLKLNPATKVARTLSSLIDVVGRAAALLFLFDAIAAEAKANGTGGPSTSRFFGAGVASPRLPTPVSSVTEFRSSLPGCHTISATSGPLDGVHNGLISANPTSTRNFLYPSNCALTLAVVNDRIEIALFGSDHMWQSLG